jgi:hypothetical protein
MIVSRLRHSIHKVEGNSHSRSSNLATRMLRLLRRMGLLLAPFATYCAAACRQPLTEQSGRGIVTRQIGRYTP